MLNLIFAVISSALVSIFMRLSVKKVENNITALSVNYFTCMLLAYYYVHPVMIRGGGNDLVRAAILGLIAGTLLLAGFILLQFNVRVNGVVMSGTFAKLGVLVPAVISVVCFDERMKLVQAIGFLLALIAIILINMDKEESNVKFKTGLVLLLIGSGCADAMAKIYEELGSARYEDFYLWFTFVAAAAFSVILVLIKRQKVKKNDIVYGILLGIPNYYSIRFLMKALADIPAVITYPTYSVATIVVISMAGVLMFKEKLNVRQKQAIAIIMVSLVMLNI